MLQLTKSLSNTSCQKLLEKLAERGSVFVTAAARIRPVDWRKIWHEEIVQISFVAVSESPEISKTQKLPLRAGGTVHAETRYIPLPNSVDEFSNTPP